jgi:hypothetical protein
LSILNIMEMDAKPVKFTVIKKSTQPLPLSGSQQQLPQTPIQIQTTQTFIKTPLPIVVQPKPAIQNILPNISSSHTVLPTNILTETPKPSLNQSFTFDLNKKQQSDKLILERTLKCHIDDILNRLQRDTRFLQRALEKKINEYYSSMRNTNEKETKPVDVPIIITEYKLPILTFNRKHLMNITTEIDKVLTVSFDDNSKNVSSIDKYNTNTTTTTTNISNNDTPSFFIDERNNNSIPPNIPSLLPPPSQNKPVSHYNLYGLDFSIPNSPIHPKLQPSIPLNDDLLLDSIYAIDSPILSPQTQPHQSTTQSPLTLDNPIFSSLLFASEFSLFNSNSIFFFDNNPHPFATTPQLPTSVISSLPSSTLSTPNNSDSDEGKYDDKNSVTFGDIIDSNDDDDTKDTNIKNDDDININNTEKLNIIENNILTPLPSSLLSSSPPT